jgi:hypothetical protein
MRPSAYEIERKNFELAVGIAFWPKSDLREPRLDDRIWPRADWQLSGDRKRKRTFDGQSQSA